MVVMHRSRVEQNKKIVVITGATRGIGKAIGEGLENSYEVISIGRQKHKGHIPGKFIKCDVTNREDIKRAINKIIGEYGRIDILINCAGVMLYNDLTKATEEEFEKSFSVNVKGTFLMMKEVLPHMRKRRKGYIINISSVRGITAAPNKGIYSATKFAVRALTETVFLENKDFGIKATAICPGIVWTESTKDKLIKEGLSKEDVVQEEDIVKTVKYLLSLSPKAYVREIVIGGRLHG